MLLELWHIIVISVISCFVFISSIAGGIYYFMKKKRTTSSSRQDEENISADSTSVNEQVINPTLEKDTCKVQELESVVATPLSPPRRHHYNNDNNSTATPSEVAQHIDVSPRPLRLFSLSPLHKPSPSTQSSIISINNTGSIGSHRTTTPFQGYTTQFTYNGPTPPWTQYHSEKPNSSK